MLHSFTRILLVEDNACDAELAVRALKKQRLANRITHLTDGEKAIDYLFNDPENLSLPHVILLDLKLPKVSGLEVLKRIKSEPRTKKLPVIMLTSSRQDDDLEKAYTLGVNSYIVKPVESTQFMEAVGKAGLYWVLLNELPTNGR